MRIKAMKRKAVISLLAITAAISMAFAGCGAKSTTNTTTTTVSVEAGTETGTETAEDGDAASEADTETSVSDETTAEGLMVSLSDLDLTAMFTDRDSDASYDEVAGTIAFDGTSAEVTGNGVTTENGIVTITQEGTYVISGEASDGQIIVAAEDTAKVQLVLNGVSITNDDGPAILVKTADKVFVTLAEGTENVLADTGAEYTQLSDVDSTIDGVIFAETDLTLNGSGSLSVTTSLNNGIVSKDDLKITGGTYNITTTGKGIQANDSIRINGGEINVDAVDDAIHTSKEDEAGKGYIYIAGGTLTLSSEDDGIHAGTALIIADGVVTVTDAYEGLEGDTIDILGGDVNVTASDDGFNASTSSNQDTNNEALEGNGGPTAPGEGEMPEGFTEGEQPTPPADGQAPEGFTEGEQPTPPADGQAPQGFTEGEQPTPPTDGEMPADFQNGERPERPEGGFGGGGFGGFDVDNNAYIHISGGNVVVNADGDGLDSNGEMTISGGTVTVYGPTNNGNGALDVGSTATVTGGTVLVAGSSGMAVGFNDTSTQYSIKYNFESTVSGGNTVTFTDSEGNVVLSFTPEKDFQNVVLSSSDLAEGTYTISAGDLSEEITIDSIATSAGTETGFGGFGGGGGRGGFGRRQGNSETNSASAEQANTTDASATEEATTAQ